MAARRKSEPGQSAAREVPPPAAQVVSRALADPRALVRRLVLGEVIGERAGARGGGRRGPGEGR